MAHYINDDAPISPNLRQAGIVSINDLEQIMIKTYNTLPSVCQCKQPFNPVNYTTRANQITDLAAIISLEDICVSKDLTNINFNLENMHAETPNVYTYAGDSGTDLCGLQTLSNKLTFCGIVAGGDWESPLFYIIYYDGTKLRAYIPIRGNIVNADTLSAFGSETNLNNPNAPYNLPQLYAEYKTRNLLIPQTATLDEFIDNDSIASDSYMRQYGLQMYPCDACYIGKPDAIGFNWDAIREEIEQTIQVI